MEIMAIENERANLKGVSSVVVEMKDGLHLTFNRLKTGWLSNHEVNHFGNHFHFAPTYQKSLIFSFEMEEIIAAIENEEGIKVFKS